MKYHIQFSYRTLTFSQILFTASLLLCMLQPVSSQIPVEISEATPTLWRGTELSPQHEYFSLSSNVNFYQLYPDTMNSVIYLVAGVEKKGKRHRYGTVIAYDLNKNSRLWQVPIDFNREQFFMASGRPVITSNNHSSGLDPATGETVWTSQAEIGFVTNSGVGVARPAWESNTIVGIDLASGEEIWKTSIRYGDISSLQIHGDTAATFLYKGLNYLNLNSGKHWQIEAKTYGGPPASMANPGLAILGSFGGGLLGGLIFGVAVAYIPGKATVPQRVASNFSNVLITDKAIYFSSESNLYKTSHSGTLEWTADLEKKIGPVHKIFKAGDAVYLVSRGKEITINGPVFHHVVLHQIDTMGQKPIRSRRLDIDTQEYLQDFLIKDSTLVLALNSKIIELDQDSLEVVQEKSFADSNTKVGFGQIMNPPAILFQDEKFVSGSELYPNSYFVENPAGMKIRFSNELEPKAVIRAKDYFFIKNRYGQNLLISNGTDAVLINSEGKKITDLNFSTRASRYGDWFIDYEQGAVLGVKL